MNKNLILVIVLVALVVVSTIQAFQLVSLKSHVESSSVKLGNAKTTQTSTGGSAATSGGSADQLPGMVGGC